MSFSDVIKKSVLESFNYTDFSSAKIAIILAEAFIVALYIFFVYRYLTRSSFYSKSYSIAMALMSVVTAAIMLAMQSNLVISLGMVGALSIVRFRTAIKEPVDLLFLFWSIATGIITGAGLFELSIILALVVTVGLLVLQLIPVTASPELLILKLDKAAEEGVMNVVKAKAPKFKVDSKSITKNNMTLIIEVRSKEASAMVDEISAIEGVVTATLMHHEGEVKN